MTQFLRNVIEEVGNLTLAFFREEEIDVTKAISMLHAMKKMSIVIRKSKSENQGQQKTLAASDSDSDSWEPFEIVHDESKELHRAIEKFSKP